jgi:hypothetical protein|tara:strand:+ start:185 stop:364 length:180 start_codon:yes stop_codon:yes gene_type:complete
MHKLTMKKDVTFRDIEYLKGETYEVSGKIRRVFLKLDAIETKKTTKKKSKSVKDLDTSI